MGSAAFARRSAAARRRLTARFSAQDRGFGYGADLALVAFIRRQELRVDGVWTFWVNAKRYELRERNVGPSRGSPVGQSAHAETWFGQAAEDPLNRRVFASAAARLGQRSLQAERGALCSVIARAVARGDLRLATLHEEVGLMLEREATQDVPEWAKRKQLTWIEVRLVDEADEPVAGVRYRIELSDGSLQRGKTDAMGRLRYQDIPDGTCQFSFDLDEQAWERA